MKYRLSTIEDIPRILSIIADAQAYLRQLGIDQWQNGYPNHNQILQDITNSESYVAYIGDNEKNIVATAMLSNRDEPTYQNIEGQWLTPNDITNYGVVHRMAVSAEYRKKGYARLLVDKFEKQIANDGVASMRIDTHEDNQGMQHVLNRMGYDYCGVIYLANGDKRLAFEKIILDTGISHLATANEQSPFDEMQMIR